MKQGQDPDRPRPDDVPADDAAWERLLAEFNEDSVRNAAVKEPSARARMLAARWRENPPVDTAWRAPAAKPGRNRGRRGVGMAVVVLCVVLAVAVVFDPGGLLSGLTGGGNAGGDGPVATEAPETAAPSAPPPTRPAPDLPTAGHPLLGSPAASWAGGAAGIALPEAAAVGGFSAADVAAGQRRLKSFLVASNLDPAVLRGGRPRAALDLLDPREKDLRRWAETSLDRPAAKHDPLALFTRFAPDEVRVLNDEVKVRGRMTAAPGPKHTVRVTADYTFVYPVVRATGSADDPVPEQAGVARAIIRRVITVELADPNRTLITPGPGRLWIADHDSNQANSACDTYDGFLHPAFPDDPRDPTAGPSPSGTAIDPYDRSRSLPSRHDGHCNPVSRT